MSTVALPMFPLGTVLFPRLSLRLHVFEERYRALMADILDGERTFGVVLIERGHEVGGGDQRFTVGTIATVVEHEQFSDGRYALVAAGSERFHARTWLPEQPYPRAQVEIVPPADATADTPAILGETERLVRRAIALSTELGDPAPPVGTLLAEDLDTAVWQLCALAPVGALDRQRVLEIPHHDERLASIHRFVTPPATEGGSRRGCGGPSGEQGARARRSRSPVSLGCQRVVGLLRLRRSASGCQESCGSERIVASALLNGAAQGQRSGRRKTKRPLRLTSRPGSVRTRVRMVRVTVS